MRSDLPAKSRDPGLDALRLLGLTAVVAGHTWPDHPLIRLATFSWHVPVFFFLSGWLWRSGRPLQTELRNRGRTLLVPYATWLVVIGSVFFSVEAMLGSRPSSAELMRCLLAGSGMPGRPYEAFWFVTALAATAIIYRLLDRLPLSGKWLVGAAGLVAGTLAGPTLAALPLSVGMAIPAIVFLIAGETTRRFSARVRHPFVIAAALLLTAVIMVTIGRVRPVDMKAGDLGTPFAGTLLALAICIALTLTAVSAPLSGRLTPLVTTLARTAILVVLTHPTVLWLSGLVHLPHLVQFALGLAVPVTFALLIARTAAAPLLLGLPRGGARNPYATATAGSPRQLAPNPVVGSVD